MQQQQQPDLQWKWGDAAEAWCQQQQQQKCNVGVSSRGWRGLRCDRGSGSSRVLVLRGHQQQQKRQQQYGVEGAEAWRLQRQQIRALGRQHQGQHQQHISHRRGRCGGWKRCGRNIVQDGQTFVSFIFSILW